MTEKTNASQFPRIFYARHMQPGIAKYDEEVVLVDTDAIKRMVPTGIGKPVYINHQKVDLGTMKEEAAGWITDSFYNELDGWAWFKFLAIDDECYLAIANGWAVSNAYLPSDFGPGGTKNNCPYDREFRDGAFTHLAIVATPRYEGARIFSADEFKAYQDIKKRELTEMQNSKPKEGKTMFKLFKNTKEEVKTVDSDTMVELEDGTSITISEMINSVKKNADDEKKKKEMENADQMIECDGEEMPLKELINRYSKLNKAKKNEAEEEEEKKKKDEDEKKNAAEDEAKKKKEAEEAEERKNAKHFEEIKNAGNRTNAPAVVLDTVMDKLERGKLRYSKQK